MDCKIKNQESAPKASIKPSNDEDCNQRSFLSATSKPIYSRRFVTESFNSWKDGQQFNRYGRYNYQETRDKQIVQKIPQQQNYQTFRCKPDRYNDTAKEMSWNENYRNTKPSYVPKSHSFDVREELCQKHADLEGNDKYYKWFPKNKFQKNRNTSYEAGMGFQKLNNFIFLVDSPDVYGKRTQNNSQSYYCKSKNNYASNSQQNSSEDDHNNGTKINNGMKTNNSTFNRNNRNDFRDHNSYNRDMKDGNFYNRANSYFNRDYSQYLPYNTNREEYYLQNSNRKPLYEGNNNRTPNKYRPFFSQNTGKGRGFNENAQKENVALDSMKNKGTRNDPKTQNMSNFNYQNRKYPKNFNGGRLNQKSRFNVPKNGYSYGSYNAYSYGPNNYTSYGENALYIPPVYRNRSGQQCENGGQACRPYNTNYNTGYYKNFPFKNFCNNKTKNFAKMPSANQPNNQVCKDNNKSCITSRNTNNNCKSGNKKATKMQVVPEKSNNPSCGPDCVKVDNNSKQPNFVTINEHSKTV